MVFLFFFFFLNMNETVGKEVEVWNLCCCFTGHRGAVRFSLCQRPEAWGEDYHLLLALSFFEPLCWKLSVCNANVHQAPLGAGHCSGTDTQRPCLWRETEKQNKPEIPVPGKYSARGAQRVPSRDDQEISYLLEWQAAGWSRRTWQRR